MLTLICGTLAFMFGFVFGGMWGAWRSVLILDRRIAAAQDDLASAMKQKDAADARLKAALEAAKRPSSRPN